MRPVNIFEKWNQLLHVLFIMNDHEYLYSLWIIFIMNIYHNIHANNSWFRDSQNILSFEPTPSTINASIRL